MGMMRVVVACVLAVTIVAGGRTSRAAAPIPVMLLDGESGGAYHDWQRVTPVLKKILDETGLFAVTVVTAPAATGELTTFAPEFGKYKVVVMNYDAPDERWPASLKTSFEQYMTKGGGLVSVHAADNAFAGWAAFNEMIGVGGWRNRTEQAGPNWYVRDGKVVSDSTPGRAGSHGTPPALPDDGPRCAAIRSRKACRRCGCIRPTSSTPRCAVRGRT